MTDLDTSLREAMKQEPLQTDSQETETPKELESGQEQAVTEGAEVQETEEVKPFAEKPDLQGRTPEELEEIYSNWNKTYTQTRQKERAELREAQERLKALESQLSQVQKQSQRDIVSPDLEERKDLAAQAVNEGSMTVQEYTAYVMRLTQEEARRAASETFTQMQQQQQEEQYQQKALDTFMKDGTLNPDSPTFDRTKFTFMQGNMAAAMDDYIEENGTAIGFDYQTKIDELNKEYDDYITGLVSQRVQKSTEAAREKARTVQKTSINGKNTPAVEGKKSLNSLIRSAMKG